MELFFEYQNKHYSKLLFLKESRARQRFKSVLKLLWNERTKYGLNTYFNEDENSDNPEQQFFTFFDNKLQAGKYVGVIKYDNKAIQILPKIFEKCNIEDKIIVQQAANAHLLWWLSWCTKIHFPKSRTSWNPIKFDFLDILIFLFASLTKDDLIFNKHQAYQEKEESIGTVRGRIDFQKYAVNYFTGNAQIIPCIYDSLEIDNLYNRIIKYISKLLLRKTENEENKRLLQEIVWVLDEVEDIQVNVKDCDKVIISPLNYNMRIIMDYCKMFLAGMTIYSTEDELEIFAFLIPMEKLFEDFIFGFIKQKFEYRKGVNSVNEQGGIFGQSKSLAKKYILGNTDPAKFSSVIFLKPDVYIERETSDIIIDTKYKRIYTLVETKAGVGKKSGPSRDDIYQMLGYAIRFNIKNIHLIYPDKMDTQGNINELYEITDEIAASNNLVKIQYHRVPIIIRDLEKITKKEFQLKELFEEQEKLLFKALEPIIYG